MLNLYQLPTLWGLANIYFI